MNNNVKILNFLGLRYVEKLFCKSLSLKFKKKIIYYTNNWFKDTFNYLLLINNNDILTIYS